jgi:cytidylate kinase
MSLITLTSGIGCGESAIARLIKENLNMEIYDDQKLQEKAVAMGIPEEEARNLDEKAPGLLTRLLNTKPQTYLEVMESVVYEVSSLDDAIILGHGSPFLLRDFGCALHVRVHASNASRIETLEEEQGVSSETATKLIQKSDGNHRAFMQYAFGMIWDDPSLYDLIVNRDKLGIEGAAELITAAKEAEQLQVCSLSAIEEMERRALTKKVEATILKTSLNPGNLNIEVVEKGVIHLTGIINPLESRDKIIDAIRSVPGVEEVKADLKSERLHDI